MNIEVKSNVLDRQFFKYQKEYEEKVLEILRKGWYVLGPEVNSFEEEFASYIGTNYCVGLANGLDALWLAFRILGVKAGDEVIVQSNTYIASVMGITINGATPIFVEPNQFHNTDFEKIEELITKNTKAILVTHLYGQATEMNKIVELCEKYKLYLVEDCAQAHGAKYRDKKVGSYGIIGCWSFYPSKNLGAFGDAGAITTNSKELADKFKIYRNYGSEKRYYNQVIGANSRLDELQAALLRIKLRHIDELTQERILLANRYLNEITNNNIELPKLADNCTSVWHLFVIRTNYREELIEYLTDNNIHTIIHYPIPPHLAEAYRYLNYKVGDFPIAEEYASTVLTLPLYNGMTEDEQKHVIDIINDFKKESK